LRGKTPEAFFGIQGQVTNTSDHSQEQTFRDVTLAEPGTYQVSAKLSLERPPHRNCGVMK